MAKLMDFFSKLTFQQWVIIALSLALVVGGIYVSIQSNKLYNERKKNLGIEQKEREIKEKEIEIKQLEQSISKHIATNDSLARLITDTVLIYETQKIENEKNYLYNNVAGVDNASLDSVSIALAKLIQDNRSRRN